MRLFYALVVLLSAVALVAAAPFPKELSRKDIAVANQESQPLTKSQLKSDRSRVISKRRTKKKRQIPVPQAAPTSSDSRVPPARPAASSPDETGRSPSVSKDSTGARPVSSAPPSEAPPVDDSDGKRVKEHHRHTPKHKKKKKEHRPKKHRPKKHKPKKHHGDDSDTGSDDDPGTDNRSEDEDGTDRDG